MKKLTVLVALLLCVTIGGVYAAWTYTASDITPATNIPANKLMVDPTFNGASGSYHVNEGDNTATIYIDAAEGTLNTVLSFSGSIIFTFDPADTISSGPLARALNATITVTAIDIDLAKYDNTQIFQLDSDFKIELTEDDWDYDTASGNYTYELKAEKLADAITLTKAFTLGSYDKYLDFEKAQARTTFKLHINPAPASTQVTQ